MSAWEAKQSTGLWAFIEPLSSGSDGTFCFGSPMSPLAWEEQNTVYLLHN